ncbi:hypothetical protein [Nostoc sp. NMS9]|uniref:hypothetical protein n=1 Tax=Nostoc sp. NMS9 TaxID=2815393 RepID=UPI0025EDA735|nr:hypothetical protein [Nostoc sp. NMS9]MBN3944484.1 hypothetical protein [Nostoc sp. NMS9]
MDAFGLKAVKAGVTSGQNSPTLCQIILDVRWQSLPEVSPELIFGVFLATLDAT